MQSNKIIIMSSSAQSPIGGPPQDFGPPVGSGPIAAAEVRILYLLVQIQHGLGRMEEAIATLKATTQSQNEDIRQLVDRMIRIEATLPDFQKTVERHDTDLNELRRRLEKDVNELGKQQTKDLNETGRRLDREIGDLRNIAHTAVSFGKFALALLAGGVLAELIRHFYSK